MIKTYYYSNLFWRSRVPSDSDDRILSEKCTRRISILSSQDIRTVV